MSGGERSIAQAAADIITDLIDSQAAQSDTNCRVVEDHLRQLVRNFARREGSKPCRHCGTEDDAHNTGCPNGRCDDCGRGGREEPETVAAAAIVALREYVSSAGVPLTEFDPEFVVRMMGAMMVSFHKYGRVADAYPLKFDAASDVRARMAKYRETGNKHYLVDAANFAMIEAMHSGRKGGSQWGTNDAADSPGRTTASGHRLIQETNDGTRIMGETILHIPGDAA